MTTVPPMLKRFSKMIILDTPGESFRSNDIDLTG
jgi:hypothetical protein